MDLKRFPFLILSLPFTLCLQDLQKTWIEFDEFDYYVAASNETYSEANNSCNNMGGDLASMPPTLEHVYYFLADIFDPQGEYWVNSRRVGDTYYWDDNKPVQSDWWYDSTEPNLQPSDEVIRWVYSTVNGTFLLRDYGGELRSNYYVCRRPNACQTYGESNFIRNRYNPASPNYGVIQEIENVSATTCAYRCTTHVQCRNIGYERASRHCTLFSKYRNGSPYPSNSFLKLWRTC